MIKALQQIKELVSRVDEEEKRAGPNVTDINQFEKTFNQIKRLVDLQSTLKKNDDKDTAQSPHTIPNFIKWLSDNGCKEAFNKVDIKGGLAEGCGLVAKGEIKEGEEFIVVPSKLFMTQETALKAFGEKIIREQLFRAIPTLLLTMQIMIERDNPKSFWAPYLKMLPRQYNTALQFTMENFRSLQGSPSLDDAISTYRNTLRQYCYLYDFLNRSPGLIATSAFTWEAFTWAVSTVMTRQNKIPWGSIPLTGLPQLIATSYQSSHRAQMSLIPFWDLCNHLVSGKITTFYEADRNALTCSAVRTFAKDEQVLIHYGDRPNSQLLLYSGFCVAENPFDCYKLKMTLLEDPSTNAFHDKMHVLEERGMAAITPVTLEANATKLPDALIPYYRVAALNTEELAKLAPKPEDTTHNHHQDISTFHARPTSIAFDIITERNEQIAFQLALNSLKKKLLLITEDESMINNAKTEMNRYVLYLKLSEKKILQKYIQILDEYLKAGVMNAKLEKPEIIESVGHGHAHGGHGHSHGGKPCDGNHGSPTAGHGHSHGSHGAHGHSHGNHGHSHGGKPCDGNHGAPAVGHSHSDHGHSHGSPTVGHSHGDHGHSHGGKPCDGNHGAPAVGHSHDSHGHSHSDHGHSHGDHQEVKESTEQHEEHHELIHSHGDHGHSHGGKKCEGHH